MRNSPLWLMAIASFGTFAGLGLGAVLLVVGIHWLVAACAVAFALAAWLAWLAYHADRPAPRDEAHDPYETHEEKYEGSGAYHET